MTYDSSRSGIGLLVAALIVFGVLNAWLYQDYIGLFVLGGAVIVGLLAAQVINGG